MRADQIVSLDRDGILDLAEHAGASGNRPLRGLLLTVAGMLDPAGEVVDPRWESMTNVSGPFGKGLDLALRRQGRVGR